MSEHLVLTRQGPVAVLTIDRPAKRNAMSLDMWLAVPAVAAEVAADDTVRALVLRGGDHFSAGADISEFAALRADADGERRYSDAVLRASEALSGLGVPTIAAITGFCVGGGCELALSCDMRVAAEDSLFAITPAKLGIVFNLPSTKRLVDAVGAAWAKQILFSADTVDADTAARIGLVNSVHPAGEVVAKALALAGTMASRSRVTILGAKEIVARIVAGDAQEDAAVRALYERSVRSADYAEGVAAFLEKRAPSFD